ncbi:MAG: hypothetical protein A2512_01580 [Deltaproteobacteria bacterium RIFOXYD12_FULL_56_24]|nr:MAG: hypothetical protein A2512_01580 [Deltaproteobacteria bacterium RIFOXYD12_FULL_56_24]
MSQYFFISGSVFAALLIAGYTSAEVLASALDFFAAKRTALLASGLLGVIALVGASLLFRGIGFFNILYVMAKAVYKLAQLLLCAMSLAALGFWFDLGANIWLEGGGVLAFVLLVWLYGAALCLRLFDFNYPVGEVLFSYSVLPFACIVVIWAGSFIR